MASYTSKQSTGTVRLGMLLCTILFFSGVEQTHAMFLFRSSNDSAPHQSIVTSNTNNGSPSIDARPLTVAPEPGSIWLLASGLMGLGLWRLRKR
jgi:PEP-CTERM motif